MTTTAEAQHDEGSRHRDVPRARERLRAKNARRVVLRTLSPAARADLCATTYRIYSAYKNNVDPSAFERAFFGSDEGTVVLFHADDGSVVGFAKSAIARVSHAGETHAVFSGQIYIDTRYRSMRAVYPYAFGETLRFKLREPRTPLGFLGVMVPAAYCRLANTFPECYPTYLRPTPPGIAALMLSVARARGLTIVDEERLVVTGLGVPAYPAKARSAQSFAGDPHARFYFESNPRFGEGNYLLAYSPLHLKNCASGLARALRLAL